MIRALILACRAVLWASGKIVPSSLLANWQEDWMGAFWRWTLNAAETGDRESVHALFDHAKRAFRSALDARFQTEIGIAEVRTLVGSPRFCLTLCVAPLALILIASFGLSKLRGFARGLPYPDSAGVAVLAQGPPVFGVRLGFTEREMKLFAEKSQTLQSIASYVWRQVSVSNAGRSRTLGVAYVSGSFFEVLGVGMHLRDSGEFFVSHGYWKKALRGDPNAVGRTLVIDGQPARLAGVLPEHFNFLNSSIAIWMPLEADHAPPPARWWLGLHGAIGRLQPGVLRIQVEHELHGIQAQSKLARPNFAIKATPIGNLVYSELWSYGWNLWTALGIVILWTLAGFFVDRRRKMPLANAARYWGFFAVKPIMLFLALFCFLFEFTSVSELGMTGGLLTRGGVFITWGSFIAAAVILIWSWRDQPGRCRVCLHRMREPLRIGTPGQMLLEISGQEVLCPKGHGSIYTAESVLGSEISNRWMGFEEDAFK